MISVGLLYLGLLLYLRLLRYQNWLLSNWLIKWLLWLLIASRWYFLADLPRWDLYEVVLPSLRSLLLLRQRWTAFVFWYHSLTGMLKRCRERIEILTRIYDRLATFPVAFAKLAVSDGNCVINFVLIIGHMLRFVFASFVTWATFLYNFAIARFSFRLLLPLSLDNDFTTKEVS